MLFASGMVAVLAMRAGIAAPLALAEFPAGETRTADGSRELDWGEKDRARELVEQLASPSFRARQRASAELGQLGLAARDALVEGLASPDAEVRVRCQGALAKVLELDHQQRIVAFSMDTDATNNHGLAGWDRFRQLAGEGPVGRGLFVEMHKAEPTLMDSTASGPRQAGEALAVRCQQLQESLHGNKFGQRADVSLGSLAAVVFVAGDGDVAVGDQMVNYLSSFMFQPPFQTALDQGVQAPVLKKLLGAWISRTAGSPHAFHALVLALRNDLKEGLQPALQMVTQGGVQPHMLQYAILTIGKFGGNEQVAVLGPLLDDASVCSTAQVNNQQIRIEIRDVALAVLVHLTGQDHKDYGLRIEKNPQLLFNPGSLGFADSAARDQALARWRAWQEAQPKPQGG